MSSAEQHLIEGLNIAEDNNFVEQLEKAYLFLSQLYESRNQPLKSLQYYKLHKNLSDSLYNANFSKQLTDANVRFDTERKEAEITRQQLLIERQTNTRNLIIGGSLGGLVLMSSLFFAVFQRNKRRRRETELALSLEKQRANDIEELSKAKTDLFNNISHELRTPLTMIIGPLQEAEKKIQNVHLKNDVGLALKNSNRLTGLVNEILDLSKLDAGKLELEISEIRLISFLKRVFYAFTSLADSQQIVLRDNLADIKSEYEKPDNLIIKTDVIKLEKILNNLISNAITFSESGSCVELLLDKKQLAKNILSISIKDEGEGIPREEQSKIFDRYYQSSSTKSPSGTGIGLALVKELCQFLDGDIDVKSIQGGGSIFTFHFPTEKSFAESTASEIASESRTLQTFTPILFKGSKPEILIVEDDLQMARYLKNLLSDLYECTVVYNGKQALVHQALNPDPHKLVLFLLLGVGKILIMLRHNSGFPALIRRKITLSIGFIT